MKTSDKGITALIGHEGVVPGPYRDSVGVYTYGVGHTLAAGQPNPAKMQPGMPDNLDAELVKVFSLFRGDLSTYEQAVDLAITVPISQNEFDAAVSFHFNTGAITRATWVKTLNNGDHKNAAAQIMNWKSPPEIIPRRQDEQRLFRDGVYPDGKITVWQVSPQYKVIWKSARQLSPSEALILMGGSDEIQPPVDYDTALPPENTHWFAALIALILRIFRK